MSKYRFFPLLFTIAAVLIFPDLMQAQTQGKVLVETFTEQSCNMYKDFDGLIRQVASDKAGKIIYLNHHVTSLQDPLQSDGGGYSSTLADNRLAPAGTQTVPYIGAVNRTSFSGAGVPSARTETGLNFSGGSYSIVGSWVSDMESAIDAQPSSYPATIEYVDGTLDTVTAHGSYDFLHIRAKITATQSVSDSLILRFAVLEDHVHTTYQPQGSTCWPSGVEYNGIVRMVTNQDTGVFAVFPTGANSGDSKTVDFYVRLKYAFKNLPVNFHNARLIAFLEETSNGQDYKVVNAVELKKDLGSLPTPAPSISLTQSSVNDSVFTAGSSIGISYTGTALVHGAGIYYSLDNGSTWTKIADSIPGVASSTYTWTIPDTVTTKGKFKVVAVDDQSVFSIQTGNFSIVRGAMVNWTYPDVGKTDSIQAGTKQHLTWTSSGVSSVKVEWSVHVSNGQKPVWHLIADNVSSNSVDWSVPDTLNQFVDLQLTPKETSASPQQVHIQVWKLVTPPGSVKNVDIASDFAIRQVYPNPAAGQNVTVAYTSTKQKEMTLELCDLLGHVSFSERMLSVPTGDITIPTSNLAPGTYFVRMSDGEQAITKRIEILK